MHKNAILCNICGRSFFPQSLKFHTPGMYLISCVNKCHFFLSYQLTKQWYIFIIIYIILYQTACIKKHEHIPIPCQYCDVEYKTVEMPNHLRKCKKAKQHRMKSKRSKATTSFNTHKQTLVHNQQTKLNNKYENYTQLATRAKMESATLTKIFYNGDDGEADSSGNSNTAATAVARRKCAVCGRGFSHDRIGKHQRICRQNMAKRRTLFDSTKQRIEGTDMVSFQHGNNRNANKQRGKANRMKRQAKRPSKRLPSTVSPRKVKFHGNSNTKKNSSPTVMMKKKNSSNWKEQSSMLRQAIKQSRLVSHAIKNGTDLSSLPPPIPAKEPEAWVKCPTCHRTFNPQSGARMYDAVS